MPSVVNNLNHQELPLIEVIDLTFRYNRVEVLSDINLVVHKGDFLALIGPNGAGKTTLIKLLLGLLRLGPYWLYSPKSHSFRIFLSYISQGSGSS